MFWKLPSNSSPLAFGALVKTASLAFLFATICPCIPAGISACSDQGRLTHDSFGKWSDEPNPVEVYTLRNSHGLQVRILNFGGIIQSLCVPDRQRRFDDIVLGFDKIEPYFENGPHFGSIIGRYANRTANGALTLVGTRYTLPRNDGQNTLHGGVNGFDKALWKAETSKKEKEVAIFELQKPGWGTGLSWESGRPSYLYLE